MLTNMSALLLRGFDDLFQIGDELGFDLKKHRAGSQPGELFVGVSARVEVALEDRQLPIVDRDASRLHHSDPFCWSISRTSRPSGVRQAPKTKSSRSKASSVTRAHTCMIVL